VNLLEKRLVNYAVEQERFLGLNADGRAPAGSFGARIQLALLMGCISIEEALALRAFKEIRNRYAHRVNIDFMDESIVAHIAAILKYLMIMFGKFKLAAKDIEYVERLSHYKTDYGQKEAIIQMGMAMLQESFRNRLPTLRRIKAVTI